jgi:1-aminocyclopropane-1-carboxylate deaminase/D-cysteine desulfhydrase-like pyridoxal-dependent ACC family enzyme
MNSEPTSEARAALDRLAGFPRVPLLRAPTELHEMPRLRQALGGGPRLFVKRDDVIPFGFGGNKVRKLQLVAAAAQQAGADTLLTVGGVQSNHARATAAVAAVLGMRCVIVANGQAPDRLSGNALLNDLLGASVLYVKTREDRMPTMAACAEALRREGRHPYEIPLGASTPLGALGLADGVGELVMQARPDVIVHASSSAGTQAGILLGCALHGLRPRVIGISADEPSVSLCETVRGRASDAAALLGAREALVALMPQAEADDTFVGEGYGLPTPASIEASALAARTEAFFVDHTYTAKALAGLIAYVRDGRIGADETVLFWHTGGQVALFA